MPNYSVHEHRIKEPDLWQDSQSPDPLSRCFITVFLKPGCTSEFPEEDLKAQMPKTLPAEIWGSS